MNPVSVAGELIGLALDLAEGASEREREQIREHLADAEAGLRTLAPNAPRIRALVEERRRARRQDEPTGKIGPVTR